MSGGLDSCFALSQALTNCDVRLCLTFDYGQRSAQHEIRSAQEICAHYAIRHQVVSIPYFDKVSSHPFFNQNLNCPSPGIDNLDHKETVTNSAKTVWVPNRNGLFINLAAVFAESMVIDQIHVGFNAEEAATFPDNSEAYLKIVNQSLELSTLNKVKVVAPAITLVKSEILARLQKSAFPLQHIWSCYHNTDLMCGRCESCQRLKRAISQSGLTNHSIRFEQTWP